MENKNTATLLLMRVFTPKAYDKYMRNECLKFFDELCEGGDNLGIDVKPSNIYDIDNLLDKISKNGVKSLNKDEKLFLDNYSII